MWTMLTSAPESSDVLNAFAIVSLAVFGVVFLASAVFSARPGTSPISEHYSRRFIKRATAILGWVSGIGLFFLLIRLLQINPASFGLPIWIVFSWLLLLGGAAYIVATSGNDRETRRRNRAAGGPARTKRPVRNLR